ncbi:MAG: carbon-nitrogen family hydrolase [Proteobacteria bacterium]|nr:carbon-nitrogen family hydrolase [Pseudomonadota bacterium]
MALTVAAIQFDIQWNDPTGSLLRASALVAEAVRQGAAVVVLPEVFTCGFSFCTGDLAKAAYEQGRGFLKESAQRFGVWCVGSVPAPSAEGFARPFNTAFVCGPRGQEVSYSKTHLFSFGGEPTKYAAGDRRPPTIEIDGVRVTPVICYDLRFPYLFSEAAHQTDLFLVVANWPAGRKAHWEVLSRARAIENQAAVVAVNRVGQGGGLIYHGGSVGYDHQGNAVFLLDDQAGIGMMTVHPEEIATWRAQFSALADRREQSLLPPEGR